MNQPWNLHGGSHTKEYAVSGEKWDICHEKWNVPRDWGGGDEKQPRSPPCLIKLFTLWQYIPLLQQKWLSSKISLTKDTGILDMTVVDLFWKCSTLVFCFFFFPLFFLWVIYSVYKSQIKKEWWLRLFYLHSIDVLLTFLRVTHSCSWVVGLIRFLRDIRSLYWNTVRAHRPYSFDTKGHALD